MRKIDLPVRCDVFLSYAREDLAIAERVFNDLSRFELKIWFDRESMRVGQQWKEHIKQAIGRCSYFLVLLSPHSLAEECFVQHELKEAFTRAKSLSNDQTFIIPARVDECAPLQPGLRELNWVDLFPDKNYKRGMSQIIRLVYPDVYILRAHPVELLEGDVIRMMRTHDFFDARFNPIGQGVFHQYSKRIIGNDNVVLEKTTKLMWQQGGSNEIMTFPDAKLYVDGLNKAGYAHHHDWRLPTLEEAMSLLETEPKGTELYLDPVFDARQADLWTSDAAAGSYGTEHSTWWYYVSFKYGCYSFGGLYHIYKPDFLTDAFNPYSQIEEAYPGAEEEERFVRAVRSETMSFDDAATSDDEQTAGEGDDDIPF